MTDETPENPLDEIRQFLASRPPRDIVPNRGLDREGLLELNAAVGRTVTVTIPGATVEDIDGIPCYIETETVETATIAAPIIPASVLEAAGVDPSEVPNLHIIRTKGTTHD